MPVALTSWQAHLFLLEQPLSPGITGAQPFCPSSRVPYWLPTFTGVG